MLELLNQLDGFDTRGDVKVIMATNRIESLDPALIRPGRIDRKIEFPLPDVKTKRHIFRLHTSRMSLAKDVDLEEYVMAKDDLSGADIKAVCTEAGLLALRERRMMVTKVDFTTAREKVGLFVRPLANPRLTNMTRAGLDRFSTARTKARPKAFTCSPAFPALSHPAAISVPCIHPLHCSRHSTSYRRWSSCVGVDGGADATFLDTRPSSPSFGFLAISARKR